MSIAHPLDGPLDDELAPGLYVVAPYTEDQDDDDPDWWAEGWRIRDEDTAQRILDQLRRERHEIERLTARYKARKAEAEDFKATHIPPRERRAERLEEHLNAYRRLLEEEDPDLKKTLPLVGGALVRRAQPTSCKVTNPAAAIAWIREHASPGLIRTEYQVDLTGLQAAGLTPNWPADMDPRVDNAADLYDPFGERPPVDGVSIVKPADKYTAKTDKGRPA